MYLITLFYNFFEIRSEIACWDSHHSLQVNVCQRASISSVVHGKEKPLSGPHVACGPLFAHPWHSVIHRTLPQWNSVSFILMAQRKQPQTNTPFKAAIKWSVTLRYDTCLLYSVTIKETSNTLLNRAHSTDISLLVIFSHFWRNTLWDKKCLCNWFLMMPSIATKFQYVNSPFFIFLLTHYMFRPLRAIFRRDIQLDVFKDYFYYNGSTVRTQLDV
jgi:hypothetical protein